MSSLGAYIRKGSQSGVGDEEQRWWDLDFFLLHCFKSSQTGIGNPVIESGSLVVVALQPSFWYVTTSGRVLFIKELLEAGLPWWRSG